MSREHKHQLEAHFDYDQCVICGMKFWHKKQDGSVLLATVRRIDGRETLLIRGRKTIPLYEREDQ